MEPCEASSAAGSVCGGMQHGGGAPLPPHTFERAASVIGERRTEVRLREWPQHGKTLQLLFFCFQLLLMLNSSALFLRQFAERGRCPTWAFSLKRLC